MAHLNLAERMCRYSKTKTQQTRLDSDISPWLLSYRIICACCKIFSLVKRLASRESKAASFVQAAIVKKWQEEAQDAGMKFTAAKAIFKRLVECTADAVLDASIRQKLP